MTQEETLTIRAMCDAFGVTARALRFYESKELLAPIRIGQKRLYTRRDRARLKLILRGKRFGFSLEEIRQLLDLHNPADPQNTQMREAARLGRQHLAEMIEQRETLTQAIDDLQQQLDWAEEQLSAVGKTEAA
ncbi:MerR family transcriptional regulator [Mangrovicoccus algicola]|uniref:MerR family DNA-binding transcriptional regulator n=1 Tax=Mangrovicoccus algicola TaxID=2771008 RepID=A0A8J7CIE6_9RHOB|nr:MerR family DNA-binding transcriptional regulator [Mangrovicoccus algicola]MBE3639465.1 MerR family DNA-binding transcriptional regulator [Mangrovicoccus algicola]